MGEELQDRVGGERAGFACEFSAIPDKYERWDRADSILLSGDRKFLGVNFDNEELAVGVSRDFYKFGRDHFAGPAPWRPKVDQEREGGTLGDGLECRLGIGVDRLRWNFEFGVATAAAEGLAEAFVGEAVAFTALLAREDDSALVETRVQIPRNHRCHELRYAALPEAQPPDRRNGIVPTLIVRAPRTQIFFRMSLTRCQAWSRAFLLGSLPAGSSPARMKP